MVGEFWLMGGDERSRYGAEHLEKQGFSVHSYGLPGRADAPLPETFERVILPFPSFQGALLRGRGAVPVEELLCRIGRGTQIFGGLMSAWKGQMEAQGGKVCDLYGAEPLTTCNAALTVEGAICLAIEKSPRGLLGANCLVLGFGRIGKLLAHRLQAFSSQVAVAARKEKDRALAETLGHLSDQTGQYLHGLEQFDFIFNTVPAPVISRQQLEKLNPCCLLVELASQPGGICPQDCAELGLTLIPAQGLPGRFSPKSAGALYAQSILDLTFGEEA